MLLFVLVEMKVGRIYIYIPGTQMTLVLIGKRPCFGGLKLKNRGQIGSRYIHIHNLTSRGSSRL